MSVFKADGKTYDDSGRLARDIHLLTNQPGLVTAVTENTIFDNSFSHVLDNNFNPIYTKQF